MTRKPAEPGAVHNADFGHPTEPFTDLSSALWRERELLEHLLFTLTCQQSLLVAGLTRWLAVADATVVQALGDLQNHEIFRAMATDAVLRLMELPPATSLADLAAAAAAPWSTIVGELQIALSELTVEIDTVAARTDELLLASARLAARSRAELLAGPEC